MNDTIGNPALANPESPASGTAGVVGCGELVSLREIMAREEDVKRIVRLERAGDRFRYLIETPFATFPKFVIGTTDAKYDDVRLELRCGLLESAEERWPELMANAGYEPRPSNTSKLSP
jgi:hypothetical protein